MSCAGGPDLIQDGLVLHLDAADRKSYPGSGTIWTDRSGLGNNGTLTNGPTFSTANGGSIVFDGTNDYIITTANSTPNLNLTSQVAIDVWLQTSVIANNTHGDGVVCKGLATDGNAGIYEFTLVQTSGINYPYFRTRIGGVSQAYYPTNIPINLNYIYNIVCTYNGSSMKIFINGIECGSGLSATGNFETNTEPLTIGVRYRMIKNNETSYDSYFTGNIYSTKIYNRALSAVEIKQNYNSQKSRFNLR